MAMGSTVTVGSPEPALRPTEDGGSPVLWRGEDATVCGGDCATDWLDMPWKGVERATLSEGDIPFLRRDSAVGNCTQKKTRCHHNEHEEQNHDAHGLIRKAKALVAF
ncbi:unnamed protein product [Heligmosomoides polygyrus]|uniref:Uncharacterized protein n=1 Tax=Heligmosomoides polygyrus TaxID=6339 RepID=A0A183G491_HELPZ|nr:unnamed protein product [Heligmosomoides polygyrus]